MKKKKQDISKIKCKHGWRPWSIVCVHLIYGTHTEWIPLPQKKGSKYKDWLCPECLANWEKITKERQLEDIRPICVDCVETMRRVLDRNCPMQ